MDCRKTIREIGAFETGVNLAAVSSSQEVFEKAGAFMPLPFSNIRERAQRAAQWLCSFGKRKYLFLTPELALVEDMARMAPEDTEAIFILPCDMDPEARERLKNNLPHGMTVSLLEEPFFPADFLPSNGMMVMTGYTGGSRAMVLPDTYRMAEHYSGFLGKKAFVSYVEMDIAARYSGWMELNPQRITMNWRDKE